MAGCYFLFNTGKESRKEGLGGGLSVRHQSDGSEVQKDNSNQEKEAEEAGHSFMWTPARGYMGVSKNRGTSKVVCPFGFLLEAPHKATKGILNFISLLESTSGTPGNPCCFLGSPVSLGSRGEPKGTLCFCSGWGGWRSLQKRHAHISETYLHGTSKLKHYPQCCLPSCPTSPSATCHSSRTTAAFLVPSEPKGSKAGLKTLTQGWAQK